MSFHPRSGSRLLATSAFAAAFWALAAPEAAAAPTCTATMSGLNFGDVDLTSGAAFSSNASLSYNCTNDQTSVRYMRVCFNIGNGTAAVGAGGGHWNPRVLANGAGTLMNFQLYQGTTATIWGSAAQPLVPEPYTVVLEIPAQVGSTPGTVSGSYTMRGEIASGQAGLAPGLYTSAFSGGNTALRVASATTSAGVPSSCASVTTTAGSFGFNVSANVLASCLVSADPLDFGVVDGIPSATNIDATSAIRVTCSSGTAYAVRLLPSNNDANGASAMKGQTAGNTDTVPYRLYSNAARSTAWGNLATNDVEGNGNGSSQSLTVYGRVPGLPNVRPDNYKDTVTVNVVY